MHQLLKGRIGFGRQPPMDLLEAELARVFFHRPPRRRFSVPLAFHGSDFTKAVWHALVAIPAERNQKLQRDRPADRPDLQRSAPWRARTAPTRSRCWSPATGSSSADGSLTGYGGGLWRKQKLIEIERQYA